MAGEALEGRTLAGRYRVLRALGAGGMGAVFEAEDLVGGARVALKVLAPELGEDPRYVERFRREAEATARLAHPSIIVVHDFVTSPGAPVLIVMELLVGESLQEVVKRGALPARRAVEIALDLAGALGTAHAAGVVHRDLKPANVMLVAEPGRGERAKLLDFGIVKLKESEGYDRLTRTGVLIGTPRFASPEQVTGRRDVDHRTDVFSLGVLLYGMLTGRPPFTERGAELLIEIQRREPPAPHLAHPGVPPALSEVVARAMRKAREERYASMEELAAALAPFASLGLPNAELPLATASGAPPAARETFATRHAGHGRAEPDATSAASPVARRESLERAATGAPTKQGTLPVTVAASGPATAPPPVADAWVPPPTASYRARPPSADAAGPLAWNPPQERAPSPTPPRPSGAPRVSAPSPRASRVLLGVGLGLGVLALLVAAAAGITLAVRSTTEPASRAAAAAAPRHVPSPSALALGPECVEYERVACSCVGRHPALGGEQCPLAREGLDDAMQGTPTEQDAVRAACAEQARLLFDCATLPPP